MNPPCPYCQGTQRYTDPHYQVRCTTCFNHLDGTPDQPMGQLMDLEAPMTIHHTIAPQYHEGPTP